MIENFEEIICLAVKNNKAATEKLIKAYMPLILKYSTINNKVDEDLRETIIMKIIKNIYKFKLDY